MHKIYYQTVMSVGTSYYRILKAASKLFLIVNQKIKMVDIWPSMQCCSSLKHTKQKGTIDIFSALKYTEPLLHTSVWHFTYKT